MTKKGKKENKYVDEIANILSPHYKWIRTRSRPRSSKIVKEIESELKYLPILQPEIDICMLDSNDKFTAIEVKACTKKNTKANKPFYEGIGQAIALTRYGFDAVALWFILDNGSEKKSGAQAWWFIRNEFKLPLDFSFFVAKKNGDKWQFDTLQYLDAIHSEVIGTLGDPPPEWKYPNPILQNEEQRIIRKHLLEWIVQDPNRCQPTGLEVRGPSITPKSPVGATGPAAPTSD
jgi:hypothetical protein